MSMRETPKFWQDNNSLSILLTPFSWLYQLGAFIDRKIKQSKANKLPIPVIVVGNISMGGSGKTPTIIALIDAFHARGINVGLLSRGYGRQSEALIIADEQSTSKEIGDEPYLIYQKTGVPMAIYADRYKGGKALIEKYPSLDVMLCDDGLQHYRLERTIEIAVVGQQGLGNEKIFPAGPLREKLSRLQSVDFIINNGASHNYLSNLSDSPIIELQSTLGVPYSLMHSKERPFSQFHGKAISAVAGIAYPNNFFSMLRQYNLSPKCYSFPDHYPYNQGTFARIETPILMTEKDAVKCQNLSLNDCWVVPLKTTLDDQFITTLIKMII